MKFTNMIAALAIVAAPAAWAGSLGETPTEPMMAPMAEAAPAPFDWSGFYVGLSAGKTTGDNTYLDGGSPYESADLDGQSFGGFAGYNFQRGNLVYGLELALQKVDAEYAFNTQEHVSEAHDLKLRIGYAWDNLLFYAFGGFSRGEYQIDYAIDGSYDSDGTNYGIGADYAIRENWLVGLEYIHRSLDGSLAPDFASSAFDHDIETIQLRVGFKF